LLEDSSPWDMASGSWISRPLGSEGNEDEMDLIRGDVRDEHILASALRGVEAVVHLAAKVDVRESIIRPSIYHEVNSTGTLKLLEAARKAGVSKFILASSCAVYGEAVRVPIDEGHPTSPLSPYAASKLAAEAYCHAYAMAYGLKVAILRLFNVYGPGQRDAYAGVIKRFIERVRRGRPPVIYGSGQQVRDFVHVQDVVEAFAQALKYDGRSPVTLNIGSGKGTKIVELAELVCRLAGWDELRPIRARARRGEIFVSVASIERAAKELHYRPKVSLEDGIRQQLMGAKSIEVAQ